MITSSMNKLDVYIHFMNEMKESFRRLLSQKNDFDKAFRKLPNGKISSFREWENRRTKQKYISIMSSNKGVQSAIVAANVNRGKNKWFYLCPTDLTDTMDAYSVHFFKRYAERTGKPYLMPKIMCAYYGNNCNSVKIYEDPKTKDNVYACNEGLNLCRFDKEHNITLHATFVSKDMLNTYQREAFELAFHKINEADVACRSLVDDDDLDAFLWKEQWTDTVNPVTVIASEIYGKYYEELRENE